MGLFGGLNILSSNPGINNFVGDITGRTAIEAGDVAASNVQQGSQRSIDAQLANSYLASQQTLPQRMMAEALLLNIPVDQTSAYHTQLDLYNRLPASAKSNIAPPSIPTGGIFDTYKEGGIQSALQSLPGFQFGLQKQTQGLQAQASKMGNVLSSQNLKNLNASNQDYASNQYGNLINNLGGTQLASQLAPLMSQVGQNVGNTEFQTGRDTAQALSGALLAKAQASQNLLRTAATAGGSASGGGGGMGGGQQGFAYL